MAKCEDCNKGMLDKNVETCTNKYIQFEGDKKVYKRDTSYFDVNERCHDCSIVNKKGNIHHYGCDMERCPKYKGQLISCDCGEGERYILEKK